MSDWSFNQIRNKAEKGQYLSDAEKQYLEVDARNAAQNVLDKWKGRGGGFIVMVAALLERMGYELKQDEARKAQEKSSEQAPSKRTPSIGGGF